MLYTTSNAHTCPNAANHTPQPSNYIAWDEDCERREARGEVQTQCPACGLWAIWKKPAAKKGEE